MHTRDGDELQRLARAADAQIFELPLLRDPLDLRSFRLIGVGDGSRALRKERVEEPELGFQIVLERAVIVEVVARQVGEAAGCEADPVEPTLLKPWLDASSERCVTSSPARSAMISCKLDRVGCRKARGRGTARARQGRSCRGLPLCSPPAPRSGAGRR